MKTTRAILNDRTNNKKSSFHKICTWEHPTPYFESEKLHGYDYSHIRTPIEQLVFHKEEIRPTPISLPTPPASPEFWGTSLQKWYQKKPLFTLTAKGQVKRLEKYLQIQKTLEMCKKEHEFVLHTENMKKAYLDFEFREHQPLLYEDKDYCCVCPCNSSRRHDIDFIPADYISCSSPQPKFCVCPGEDEEEIFEKQSHKTALYSGRPPSKNEVEMSTSRNPRGSIGEEKIIPTKIIKEGDEDPDDRGIYKIILKNKELPNIPSARYVMKLYDNKNYGADEKMYYMTKKLNAFQEMPNIKEDDSKSGLSKITLNNIASLPFDITSRNNHNSTPRSGYSYRKTCPSCQNCRNTEISGSSTSYEEKYDINRNEIPYNMGLHFSDINK